MEVPIEAKRAVFAAVASQMSGQPKIARLATSLAKNFKSTASDPLERAKNLAYLLYVHEQPALSLQVCELLNDITFKNNYNLWTWVELTLALEWKLRVDAGQAVKAQACADIIRDTDQTGSETERLQKIATLEHRLTGSLLYDTEITNSQQRGDKTGERTWRMLQLGALLFIEALGGSDVLPVSDLEQQVVFNLVKLRSA
ncbi:DUF6707 family protein [Hymenobacter sp. BRD67]|uniref:DUF6707 family protein n=1 Tax=Hymenobacter sp. BRD67 TaxID=2675877 RepID=UPI00156548D0|nr:DUF6707 family protein [Hymenobacter sp. BRD67]QKG52183.1 hypothetical protein GKZ67_05625 [Hymenobacter sp. BRD67]